eukprot:3020918-Prymnesium_polylepis.1
MITDAGFEIEEHFDFMRAPPPSAPPHTPHQATARPARCPHRAPPDRRPTAASRHQPPPRAATEDRTIELFGSPRAADRPTHRIARAGVPVVGRPAGGLLPQLGAVAAAGPPGGAQGAALLPRVARLHRPRAGRRAARRRADEHWRRRPLPPRQVQCDHAAVLCGRRQAQVSPPLAVRPLA